MVHCCFLRMETLHKSRTINRQGLVRKQDRAIVRADGDSFSNAQHPGLRATPNTVEVLKPKYGTGRQSKESRQMHILF